MSIEDRIPLQLSESQIQELNIGNKITIDGLIYDLPQDLAEFLRENPDFSVDVGEVHHRFNELEASLLDNIDKQRDTYYLEGMIPREDAHRYQKRNLRSLAVEDEESKADLHKLETRYNGQW